MVQFGGADYAMSLGLTGQWGDPDVLEAEAKTIETALKKRPHPRVELGDITQASRYLEMGVKHFCIGWDVSILLHWWRANGEGMRAMLVDAAAVPGSKPAAAKPGNSEA